MISLRAKCNSIRKDVLRMLNHAGSGHSGGSLSAVELLVGIYYSQMKFNPEKMEDPKRDRFVLSKGHAAPVLYAILADLGVIDRSELFTLRQLHSNLQGHPDSKKVRGVEASTGSLGQGFSIAVGMAMAAKAQNNNIQVFSLLGDGELQEGLVWEACMAASAYKLDNLTMLVDYNGIQLDGFCEEVLSLGDLNAKFNAFGFHVINLPDGNDIETVVEALAQPKIPGKPTCIVAHTVKGKGVSFIENQVAWHGRVPNDNELALAIKELQDANYEK
ncbi:MAG: transketolase [Sphaerochaetaceae bacterium]